MIVVSFNPMKVGSTLAEKIKDQALNAAGEHYAEHLKNHLKDIKCEVHPGATQRVVVKPDAKKGAIAEMTSYCCVKFKESIKFNIK